jgi:hypothetical protein
MNAAQWLLTKSSLAFGSAGAHLASVLATGSGVVVNDGIETEVDIMTLDAEIDDGVLELGLSNEGVVAEVADNELTVEVEEW